MAQTTPDPLSIAGDAGPNNNAVPRADGLGGGLLQSSGILIDDTDNIQDAASIRTIERASAPTTGASNGSFWTRDDGVAMHTDSSGNDIELGGIGAPDAILRGTIAAATTGDIADLVAGAPDVVDDVAMTVGARVLVRAQGTGSENGIYVVDTVGTGVNGAWSRALDFDEAVSDRIAIGVTYIVLGGTVNDGTAFSLVTPGVIVIGVTSLTFGNLFITGDTAGSDNRLMRSNGTAGGKIQRTGITVDDSENVTGVQSLVISRSASPTLTIEEVASNPMTLEDRGSAQSLWEKTTVSGAPLMDVNPHPSDGTSAATVRLFRSTNTSGVSDLSLFNGDGTATIQHRLVSGADSYFAADNGDVGIGSSTNPSAKLHVFGTGQYDGVLTLGSDLNVSGSLTVQGTRTFIGGDLFESADNYVALNADYITDAAQTFGIFGTYDPDPSAAQASGVVGGFTAGVPATSQPNIEVDSTAGFAGGDIVRIQGSTSNDGYFEIDALLTTPARLEIKGIGNNAAIESFSATQFTVESGVGSVITKVGVAVWRADASGDFEAAKGSTVPLTYSLIALGSAPLAGIADANGDFLVGTGSGWVVESGTTVRASIGLGTIDTATFGDLFLSNSGGVINWNAGDVTITHGANQLSFQGASNGYAFGDGPVRPLGNGLTTLGTTAFKWGDLFLDTLGTINFDSGNVVITHSAGALAFTGATSGYSFDDELMTEAIKRAIRTYTAVGQTLTIVGSDHIVVVNRVTTNALTVALPVATGSGRELVIKRHVDDLSTTVTLDGNASETIDGQTIVEYVDAANGPSATLIDSVSGEWVII